MSTSLTAEQVESHRQNLASLTDFRVFPVLTETVFYAIFTVLIVTSSYILITRGLVTRSAKVMLATTLILYALSTWDWAIDVLLLRDDLKVFLPGDLIQPAPDHHRRVQVNTALHISQSITNNISTMLSDSVVVWRVYVVYGRNRRVLATGIALLVALFSGLLLCNLTQIGVGFPSVVHLHFLAPAELVIDIVTLIMSALVNIWATAMIGYQAWRYRRDIKRYLKDTTTRSFAENMLVLFTESGVVYTSVWILKNIIIIPEVVNTPYTTYATVIMYQLTGMYPTIIIILVSLRKSHLETRFTSFGTSTPSAVFDSNPTSITAGSTIEKSRSRSEFKDLIVSVEIREGQESRSDLESGDSKEEVGYAV